LCERFIPRKFRQEPPPEEAGSGNGSEVPPPVEAGSGIETEEVASPKPDDDE
jgi:hypothetical protein